MAGIAGVPLRLALTCAGFVRLQRSTSSASQQDKGPQAEGDTEGTSRMGDAGSGAASGVPAAEIKDRLASLDTVSLGERGR